VRICGRFVGLTSFILLDVWKYDYGLQISKILYADVENRKVSRHVRTIVPAEKPTKDDEHNGPCIAMEIFQDLV
jgi:hypothetical protein